MARRKQGRSFNIGIAWFRPDEYSRILRIVKQPHRLSGDYNQWRQKAEGTERYWKHRGFVVDRVAVDPDNLIAWCAACSVEPDGKALGNFVEVHTREY